MTNIQRYSLAVAYDRNDNANIESYEDGLGKWIKHSDHVKAMEEYARLKSQEDNKELVEALIKCQDVFKYLADAGKYPEPLLQENGGEGWKFITDLISKHTPKG